MDIEKLRTKQGRLHLATESAEGAALVDIVTELALEELESNAEAKLEDLERKVADEVDFVRSQLASRTVTVLTDAIYDELTHLLRQLRAGEIAVAPTVHQMGELLEEMKRFQSLVDALHEDILDSMRRLD